MTDTYIHTLGGNGTPEEVIAGSSQEMQEIARAARTLIAELHPGVTEVPWAQQGTVGYGVGVKKMSEQYAYIAPHKAHVNLGFAYGAELPDPEGLLEGTGKVLRHVKLRKLSDLQNPALRQLLTDAQGHLPKLKLPEVQP